MEEEKYQLENQLIDAIYESLQNHIPSNAVFLAERLFAEKDTEETRNILAECYMAENKPYKAYYILQDCKSEQNRYKYALACLKLNKLNQVEKALTIYQNDVQVNQKYASFHQQQSSEAVANGSYGLFLLGLCYERLQRYNDAKTQYQKALEMNPTLWCAYEKLCKMGEQIPANKIFSEVNYKIYEQNKKKNQAAQGINSIVAFPPYKEGGGTPVIPREQQFNPSSAANQKGVGDEEKQNEMETNEGNQMANRPRPANSMKILNFGNINNNSNSFPTTFSMQFEESSNSQSLLGIQGQQQQQFQQQTSQQQQQQRISARHSSFGNQQLLQQQSLQQGQQPVQQLQQQQIPQQVQQQQQPQYNFSNIQMLINSNHNYLNINNLQHQLQQQHQATQQQQQGQQQSSNTSSGNQQQIQQQPVYQQPINIQQQQVAGQQSINQQQQFIPQQQQSQIFGNLRSGSKKQTTEGPETTSASKQMLQSPKTTQYPQGGQQNMNQSQYMYQSILSQSTTNLLLPIKDIVTLLRRLAEPYARMCLYQCLEAIELWQKLPKNHYQTGWVLSNIGRCYMEIVKYNEAEQFYVDALKVEPYRLEGIEYYSSCLWHLKKQVELCTLAHQALEKSLFAPETWIAVGNCFSLQKEHESALKFFNRAIQLNPHNPYAHSLCAHEYVYNEDFQKARKCFENALNLDIRHYNAWWGLGNIFYKQEKYDRASEHFQKAIQINDKNPVLYSFMGMTFAAKRDFSQAIKFFEVSEMLDPNNGLNKFQKANALVKLERYIEALNELERLQQMMPKEAPIPLLMGKVYKKINKVDKAHYYFTLALDLESKDTQRIKALIESLHNNAHEFSEELDI